MFRYNVLSDLNDGSLVIPLSKNDDGTILCKKENSEETINLKFEDFNFSIKPEDRKPVESELPPEPEPPKEPEGETVGGIIEQMEADRDDSIYDGTDDTEIVPDPEKPEEIELTEGFVTDKISRNINDKAKLKDERLTYLMWQDNVQLKLGGAEV